ncbi:hypothetical protein LWI28_018326 [Acer negundo]|uniref:Uncharacterized protein n=1 Tax=Acer negundo TaxID=4023 RepID=A0AAD5IUY7_ACENE|nr:hypothetical protein LWI28_018326 [Acer negundo]
MDGKSVDSKQKPASPFLPIVGLGSKEKSQEMKVMKCRNSKNNLKLFLNFEDEISRIIRIGVALGMDFEGKKVGMVAAFAEVKRKLKLGGLRELKVQ